MPSGDKKLPLSVDGVDIKSIIQKIYNVILSRTKKAQPATCDGLVLRMHYNWTFSLLFGAFLTVWYNWYYSDVITCVSHYDANKKLKSDDELINICLSYPFLEDNDSRRYILFYRWISWSFLALALTYIIPRKVSKKFDNARCKKLLEELCDNNKTEEQQVKSTKSYLNVNLKTHNGLYWKFLSINIIALAVDFFALMFFDFVLQGRFLRYGFKAYPFYRDAQTFTDYMSQTFPPFASCQLNPVNQLVGKRTERFGCHLTLMELYEKLLLGLWLWLIVLIFITSCYIAFLLCMWLPCTKLYLLRVSKPAHGSDKVRGVVQKVVKKCKIGDIYLLYRIKRQMSHAKFYELLMWLSDSSLRGPHNESKSYAQPV